MTDSVAVFPPGFRLTDTLGVPYSGASIEFYDSGLSSGRLVYSDQGLTNTLGTIVYTDSAGYPVSASGGTNKVLVYTSTADYKVILKDSSGSPFATHDGIKGAVISSGTGGAAATITQAQADARYIRNVNALVAVSNIDDVDLMPFWDIATSTNQGISYADYKTDIGTDLLASWRAAGHIFASGSAALVFRQTSAPVGWTKIITANDRALRVVSGALVDGGSTGFSAAFPSQTPTGTITINASSLSTSQLAAHIHTVFGASDSAGATTITIAASGGTALSNSTSSSGSGSAHNHSGTFSGSALAGFAPAYTDVIMATKN